ncbi:MAG: hypothetical protein QMC98_00030 [Candidatus Thermoplasmatota archaeon]|nr:hypothetical protein [Candidatus Thermoplasmatota archaeon]
MWKGKRNASGAGKEDIHSSVPFAGSARTKKNAGLEKVVNSVGSDGYATERCGRRNSKECNAERVAGKLRKG